MPRVDLTAVFSPEQFERALKSWTWLGLDGKQPGFTSRFGDVFFQSADGVWRLDHLEGTLTRHWLTLDAMRAELNTPRGQDDYLLGGLAMSAERAGLSLGPGEIYVFEVPPILGGPIAVDAITTIDFVVGLHLLGQIHEQVSTLPPGTSISGITVDGDKP